MQIRNQHGKIQLIRTKYDPTIKRGRSILLGTLSTYALEIPIEINKKLTDAERAQLQPIIDKNMSTFRRYREENAGRNLPETIRHATKWYIANGKNEVNLSELAEETRLEFSKLRAVMAKAGVGRKRHHKKEKLLQTVSEAQSEIFPT